MKIINRTSLVAFLVALSAISVPQASAAATLEPNQVKSRQVDSPASIEDRISRLSVALQVRAQQLSPENSTDIDQLVAVGFADGSGRDWVNGRRSGWADGHGGSFSNVNPWLNGWGDGGGFANWRNY